MLSYEFYDCSLKNVIAILMGIALHDGQAECIEHRQYPSQFFEVK
jgi:hypothetical protein